MFFRLTRTIELQRLFICQRVHGNINFFFIFFFCSIEWDVAKGSVEADRGEGGRGVKRNLQKPYTEIR